MITFPQPNTQTVQSQFEAQLSLFTDMSYKLFGTVKKFNELSFQVAQSLLDECVGNFRQMMVAKDPMEILSIMASQAQPAAEKLRAYQQQLQNIGVDAQAEMVKSVEAQMSEVNRTAVVIVDQVTKQAIEETGKVAQRQKTMLDNTSQQISQGAESGLSIAKKEALKAQEQVSQATVPGAALVEEVTGRVVGDAENTAQRRRAVMERTIIQTHA